MRVDHTDAGREAAGRGYDSQRFHIRVIVSPIGSSVLELGWPLLGSRARDPLLGGQRHGWLGGGGGAPPQHSFPRSSSLHLDFANLGQVHHSKLCSG